MENDDLERIYWFCVSDCVDLLAHGSTDIETLLNDVYEALKRTKPESGTCVALLAILDQLSQERTRINANTV